MQNWYAVYVKSNHEHVVYDELQKKDIAAYLPTVRKFRQWKDRKKWINFPLFPGYLFTYIVPHPEEFRHVLKTRGVINLLAAEPGNPTTVPSEEIDSLRLLLESGNHFDVYPHLKEGSRVKIKKGPLQGAIGTLKMKQDQYIFLVNIELLGRSIGVKIYADDIEPY